MSDPQVNKPSEEGKSTSNVDTTKFVPKEEYEKLSGSVKELEAKLDEAKLSLLDPTYIEFLESKKGRKIEKKIEDAISDLDIEGLSSKQLLSLAVEEAKRAVAAEIMPRYEEYIKNQAHTLSDVLAILELQSVEKKYKDFDEYREATRKILESSQTPLTIEQAYKQAKLDKLDAEGKLSPKETPVAKKEVAAVEKPSGSIPGNSVERSAFKNKQDAAEDAWNRIVGAGKDTL